MKFGMGVLYTNCRAGVTFVKIGSMTVNFT